MIVDDHSTDDSRATAQRLLDDVDWFPAQLVARAANGGASVARNTGVAHARSPIVFTLDADCSIYPTGLRKLLVHLASAPERCRRRVRDLGVVRPERIGRSHQSSSVGSGVADAER